MSFSSSSAGSKENHIFCVTDVSLIIWPEFLHLNSHSLCSLSASGWLKGLFKETKPVLCVGPVLSHYKHSPVLLWPADSEVFTASTWQPGSRAAARLLPPFLLLLENKKVVHQSFCAETKSPVYGRGHSTKSNLCITTGKQ